MFFFYERKKRKFVELFQYFMKILGKMSKFLMDTLGETSELDPMKEPE